MVVVVMRLGVELACDRVAGEVVGVEGGGGTGGTVGALVVFEGCASATAKAEVTIDGDGSKRIIGRDLNLNLSVIGMHGRGN